MQAQSELMSLPQTLTVMFTRARPDYERAVRAIRWGTAPVHIIAGASTVSTGLLGCYAFEELLGCPVALREASSFLAYSLGTLRAGSVALLASDESPEVIEATHAARKLGAQVLAVAPKSSALARAAHALFVLPDVAGSPATGLAKACLEHAAFGYLALLAARLLKRPNPAFERLENDWHELPGHLDWIVTQLAGAVRSFAAELRSPGRIIIAGAGYYHPAALGAAGLAPLQERARVLGVDLACLPSDWPEALAPNAAVVFLSGSRGRTRKVLDLPSRIKARNGTVLAVTDNNDHDLAREARLALLVPVLRELPGSILALALAGWVAREMGGQPRRTRRAERPAPVTQDSAT